MAAAASISSTCRLQFFLLCRPILLLRPLLSLLATALCILWHHRQRPVRPCPVSMCLRHCWCCGLGHAGRRAWGLGGRMAAPAALHVASSVLGQGRQSPVDPGTPAGVATAGKAVQGEEAMLRSQLHTGGRVGPTVSQLPRPV